MVTKLIRNKARVEQDGFVRQCAPGRGPLWLQDQGCKVNNADVSESA